MDRKQLFGMMKAYQQTSLLRAAVKLNVFEHLAGGPVTPDEVGRGVGADARGARILLSALAAVRLVESDGTRFWLSDEHADLLVPGRPDYAGGMVNVFASDWEWDAHKRIADAVRHGGTVLAENAETAEYEFWEDFARYANVVAEPTADLLADALQPWAVGRDELKVLDVACGHGIYGYTVARRYEQARVWSLDWPNVLDEAHKHAVRLGVADRVERIPGDMFETPLGGPYDLVLVTNVLHHFSAERAADLLARTASALKPDGRLGIVGFTTSGKTPAEDPAPYLFDLLMLAWTTQGEVHSAETYEQLLAKAGLEITSNEPVAKPGIDFHVLLAKRAA
ncbi:methyltransferase [Nonomuraea turcica]|uniref:methyltransferase n=1 Tax=Nonomuraea sp. G32 TaxID=3067274 RepID=UPI00273B93E4|nr:methyltransferase [Nonomuraea sp. G32]MDP4503519.1 methyltransferase [Nonomuraea sp. G32]